MADWLEQVKARDKRAYALRNDYRTVVPRPLLTLVEADRHNLLRLVEYAGHKDDCNHYLPGLRNVQERACTCGYDDLLAELNRETE